MMDPFRLLLAVLGLLFSGQALADKRVALVIGNSGYQHVGRLANPANDADAVTATFKQAGFDVVESRRDLKTNEIRRVLRDFADKARDADMAVVYYAGHGIEVDGTNYLIPVDAALERDTDVFDEALALDRVLVTIEPAKKLRLVILDACRDNPFSKTMKRTLGTRAIGRGFARVEPSSPNTLIAFAAKAGSTASDGDSRNSPFTAALVRHIATPGLDLRKAFGFVRDDVLRQTSNRQEPFVYGSLGGNDVSLVPAPVAPAAAPSPAANAAADIRRDYEMAERVGTKEGWDFFINAYPSGLYADLAKAQRNKLAAELARQEATEKARRAEEDRVRLAAERAQKKEQEEAAARAKAAEQARVSAERLKREEEAKVAAAEKARAEALAKQADQERIAAERARQAEEKATADKAATEKAAAEKGAQVAALAPPAASDSAPKAETLNRQLQSELRRVGCHTSAISDEWSVASRRSLEQFNKRAGLKLDVKVASIDSLDAVKGKSGRVCPLVCEHGYRAEGEKCIEIVCKAGFEIGNSNACERIRPRQEARPAPKRDDKPAQPKAESAAKPQATSGQIICSPSGCRPVAKGCRLVQRTVHMQSQSPMMEVCN